MSPACGCGCVCMCLSRLGQGPRVPVSGCLGAAHPHTYCISAAPTARAHMLARMSRTAGGILGLGYFPPEAPGPPHPPGKVDAGSVASAPCDTPAANVPAWQHGAPLNAIQAGALQPAAASDGAAPAEVGSFGGVAPCSATGAFHLCVCGVSSVISAPLHLPLCVYSCG